MSYKSKRSKSTDIPKKVKETVWERDGWCVTCGNPYAMPNSHYVPRSAGGLGIEENIVTQCNECHYIMDFGTKFEREQMKLRVKLYLQSKYEYWNEEDLIYQRR